MQNSHKKVLNQFKAGTLEILVCTDSLARGIDIGLVDTVIKAKDLLLFGNFFKSTALHSADKFSNEQQTLGHRSSRTSHRNLPKLTSTAWDGRPERVSAIFSEISLPDPVKFE